MKRKKKLTVDDFFFPLPGELHINDNIQENTENTLLRSELIRVYPTDEQRQILNKWFAVYRWAYNMAIKYYRSHRPGKKNYVSFITIRKILTERYKVKIDKYIKDTGIPKHTIDNAFKDVVTAYKSAFSNYQNGNIKHFRLRYKKMTKDTETLCLEASAFPSKHSCPKNTWSPSILGDYIKTSKSITDVIHDSRLTFNKKTGKFILAVPRNANTFECADKKAWISLDPGIRVFQTGYDNEKFVSIGKEVGRKIAKLLKGLNKRHRFKYKGWYQRYMRRIYSRIQNIRDDLHYKTALNLVSNYENILVGNMSTISIVSKKNKALSPAQKQKALMLSHYKFNSRLKAKAEQYGSTVHMVDEYLTSKTCGGCFHINYNLKGEENYKCVNPKCSFELPRDDNSSRLIALVFHGLFPHKRKQKKPAVPGTA